jgi:hypothetical protein
MGDRRKVTELYWPEPRRISGIADRRKEIRAELAKLYHRRCDDCTATCIHAQEPEPAGK